MKAELLAALAFLTRIPVATRFRADLGTGTTGGAAFGIVGAVAGGIAAVPLLALGERAPLAAGSLAVATLAIVSGALHLDGLADTADALAAPTAEAAERARSDPRVGAAGAAAIALVIVLDASLLGALAEHAAPVAAAAGIVAATGSRALAPLAAWLARSAGSSGSGHGLGSRFVARATPRGALLSVATAGVVAGVGTVALGRAALVLGLLVGTGAGLALARLLLRARHGLDGDGFGFLVEMSFAAALVGTVATL